MPEYTKPEAKLTVKPTGVIDPTQKTGFTDPLTMCFHGLCPVWTSHSLILTNNSQSSSWSIAYRTHRPTRNTDAFTLQAPLL